VRIGTTQKQRSIYSRLGRAKKQLAEEYPDCDPAKRLDRLARILDASPKLVEEMEGRLSGHDLSLDARITTDSDTTYVDLLSDDSADTEERAGSREEDDLRAQLLVQAMTGLSDRERLIVHSRFLDNERQTLRELGEKMGISRERVRQLEMRALEKIRKAYMAQQGAEELLAG
jgi:RNA polymerase sigma-32 factor